MNSREETTGPVRMPNGVRDYLERGTTPAELAEAECAAAADPDGGRSCEAAVRRQAQVQPRPVLRLEGGQSIVSYLNERIAERDQAEAGS